MGNKWELHKALPNWSHRGLSTYNVGNYCIRASPSVDDTNGFFVARFHRKVVEDGDGGTIDVSQSDVTEEDTSDKIPFLLRPPSNDKKRKVTQPSLKVPVAKKIKR